MAEPPTDTASPWPFPFGYAELPALPPRVPRARGRVSRWIGGFVLWLLGFRVVGRFPDLPKLVLIGAPHTSNWDGIVGYAAILRVGLDMNVMVKHTLFKGVSGWLLRALGAIPVEREASGGVVGQMVRRFEESETFVLGVAPEGTRTRVTEWKTGFHRIAHEAGVPIVPVALDFGRREVRLGLPRYATDDLEADLAAFRAFYATAQGKNPENQ